MGLSKAWKSEGRYIEKSIRYWVKELVKQLKLPPDDIEDIGQELRLDLFRRLPLFDANKACYRTFISRLLRNKTETLRAWYLAGKRNRYFEKYSLDEEIDDNEEGRVRHIDLLGSDQYKEMMCGPSLSGVQRLDLSMDLMTILPRLTLEQRRICLLFLDDHTHKTAAEELGIARSTLYDRRDILRKRFSEFGYK